MCQSMISTYRLRSHAARCVGNKDYRGAIEYLRKVLERDPQDLATQTIIAQCFEWLGDFSESLEAARHVLRSDPADPFCLRFAARASVKLGQHHQARGYVEQSLNHPVV